jgi:hypothetical protein
VPIGAPTGEFGRPLVTNVHLVDLDRDGFLDVVYGEAQKNTVRWIRQAPRGVFTEEIIGTDIPAPAHVSTGDLNATGRLDVLVSSMGQLTPNNDRIGAVVVLENLDNRHFRSRVLLDRVARVTDVRAANLAGHTDGRLDLVVGQFGYAQGETRWMENQGQWRFQSFIVNTQSGCLFTPVADFDGDGAMDFAALISQEWEEVHWFRNLRQKQFADKNAWGSTNEDFAVAASTSWTLTATENPTSSTPTAMAPTTRRRGFGRGMASNGSKIATAVSSITVSAICPAPTLPALPTSTATAFWTSWPSADLPIGRIPRPSR